MPRFIRPAHRQWPTAILALWLAAAPVLRTQAADALNAPGLLLDVVVNGRPTHAVGDFTERGGKLYATRRDLETFGLKFPTGPAAPAPDSEVALDSLKGVVVRLDRRTQTIYFIIASAALMPTLLSARDQGSPSSLPIESGLGAVLNYDLVSTLTQGKLLSEAQLDARVFTPWGVADSSMLATNAASATMAPFVRLDTNVTHIDPEALIQYRAGDIIEGGLSWTRPVRLGGLQASTDFATRPDLVTFPVPSIAGEVAVPSSVDVLVNGVRILSRPVPPGPFDINQLPVVTGAANVSIIVRNAAGQQTMQTLPLYVSRLLLKPGLSDLSLEAGPVRLNYGTESDDYRGPAASVTYRRGLLPWLTLEGHAEASVGESYQGLKTGAGGMAGAGAVIGLGRLGVASADVAGSSFGERTGGLVYAGIERTARLFSLSGSIQLADAGFADLASVYGDPVPLVQARASLGMSVPVVGAFGVAYVLIRRPASRVQADETDLANPALQTPYQSGIVPLAPASKTSLLSMSYSRALFGGRISVYLSAFHDFAEASAYGLTAGVSIPIGARNAIAVGGNAGAGSAYGSVQATRSASAVGQTGLQLYDSVGQPERQMATATYRAPWGLIDAGIDRTAGTTSWRADLQGALAAADGSLFASNTIADSFAVIDTGGTPQVGVLQENRPVGHTDSSGELLVPGLRAFDTNRLGIDPNNVPFDATVGQTEKLVRPQDRSGVIVRFPIKASHGALVRLQDAAKKPLALGSVARLQTSTQGAGTKGAGTAKSSAKAGGHQGEVVVGYDGEVFLTGLGPDNTLVVTPPQGPACTARFRYKPVAGTLPDIGPVRCVPATP
jgi:outer membrane usher protein